MMAAFAVVVAGAALAAALGHGGVDVPPRGPDPSGLSRPPGGRTGSAGRGRRLGEHPKGKLRGGVHAEMTYHARHPVGVQRQEAR